MSSTTLTETNINEILQALGVQETNQGCSTGTNSFGSGPTINSISPVDGQLIGQTTTGTKEDYHKVIETAQAAFSEWRMKLAK